VSETERAILGAVLVKPELLPAAAEILVPADFSKHTHSLVWEALLRLDVDDRPIDLVSLRDELVSAGHSDTVGGATWLASLIDGMPAASERMVRAWGTAVRSDAILRRLRSGVSLLLGQGDCTAAELAGGLERLLVEAPVVGRQAPSREDVARETWATLEAEVAGRAPGIGSGFPDLDARLRCGGWRPGQLAYIGGRTSKGKSSFVLACAEVAASHDKSVLFVPLEMTPAELGAKRLIAHSGISLGWLHSWRRSEREEALATLQKSAHILTRPLDYTFGCRTIGQIRAAARRHKQRHGLDLLVVDYLGLVSPDATTKASLYERTTLVSQQLKTMAMDLNVAILCPVQLNRQPVAQGKPRRPTLADCRDSGAIEQDADIVLLIHQDSQMDAIQEGEVTLILAKQRNGWTGDISLRWRAACARFESAVEAA
jgi:replicative DNA helicase